MGASMVKTSHPKQNLNSPAGSVSVSICLSLSLSLSLSQSTQLNSTQLNSTQLNSSQVKSSQLTSSRSRSRSRSLSLSLLFSLSFSLSLSLSRFPSFFLYLVVSRYLPFVSLSCLSIFPFICLPTYLLTYLYTSGSLFLSLSIYVASWLFVCLI